MHLSADRLEVSEGERLHAVLVVHPSVVSVLAAGGIAHLTHALEDVGFRDVRAWPLPPAGWLRGGDVPKPADLEWLLWVAATPTRSASLTRALTEDVRIADAWSADLEPEATAPELVPLHPYAPAYAAPTRIAGVVHVFGVAYPFGDFADVVP